MIRSTLRRLLTFIISTIVWVMVLGIPVGDKNLHYHAHRFILGNKLTKKVVHRTQHFREDLGKRWNLWYSAVMESDEEAAKGRGRRF